MGSEDTVSVFTDGYTPPQLAGIAGFQPHPDDVTETAILGSITPPKITYALKLPKETIIRGKLSIVQLESIYYACQQHETQTRTKRNGFFMGDGPGVGKGRQIAGIVLENFLRGRKKCIWMSASIDLLLDARRDLKEIGAGSIPVHDLKDYPVGKQLRNVKILESGVIFCTYALLIRTDNRRSRLQQLIDWCGRDFDGVIAFDEVHKAKSITVNYKKNTIKGSATSHALTDLQDKLPGARVVYVSATAASDPDQLLYASRLGLWGEGSFFSSQLSFAHGMKEGGTGAMEFLAMEMKLAGKYLSRMLSFKGVTFQIAEKALEPAFASDYDAAVAFWDLLIPAALQAIEAPHVLPKVAKVSKSQLWATAQRFWLQMLMAGKIPATVRIAKKALQEGKCVVVGLQSTGEGPASEEESNGAGASTAKQQLLNFINKWSLLDADAQEAFIDRVETLRLPINPLDELIHQLGGSLMVAEMTGRKWRLVLHGGRWRRTLRAKDAGATDALNITEKKRFMAGEKLVAIISEAASTGISLQADRRVKNQRQRVHITLELPWSADKAVQQMGRSHRSNQSTAPVFVLLQTPVGGEWRKSSSVATRLKQLGAITMGDRRATTNSGIQQFSIEPHYGQKALDVLLDVLATGQAPRARPDFLEEKYNDDFAAFALAGRKACERVGVTSGEEVPKVSTFLNRLLGMTLEMQSQIFGFFTQILDAMIHDAKMSGKYQESIMDLSTDVNRIDGGKETLFEKDGVKTEYIRVVGDRGISFEKAMEVYEKVADADEESGFYRGRNKDFNGQPNIQLALARKEQTQGKTRFFKIARANSGWRPETGRKELHEKYYKVKRPSDIKAAWNKLYSSSATTCGHKSGTKSCSGADCTYMNRSQTFHIIQGSILPFWQKIKHLLNGRSIKIVKVRTVDGENLVGIPIPSEFIHRVKDTILAGLEIEEGNEPQNDDIKIEVRADAPKYKRKRILPMLYSEESEDSEKDEGEGGCFKERGAASCGLVKRELWPGTSVEDAAKACASVKREHSTPKTVVKSGSGGTATSQPAVKSEFGTSSSNAGPAGGGQVLVTSLSLGRSYALSGEGCTLESSGLWEEDESGTLPQMPENDAHGSESDDSSLTHISDSECEEMGFHLEAEAWQSMLCTPLRTPDEPAGGGKREKVAEGGEGGMRRSKRARKAVTYT